MSYFNRDQEEYMEELAAMPPEAKCACGWYRVGQCPNCKRRESAVLSVEGRQLEQEDACSQRYSRPSQSVGPEASSMQPDNALCSDCPRVWYPTNATRCAACPRRRMPPCANCGHGWPMHVIPGGVENIDIYPTKRECVEDDCRCPNYVADLMGALKMALPAGGK